MDYIVKKRSFHIVLMNTTMVLPTEAHILIT